ncbi:MULTISPECIES: hypothetical protein [unclassified Gilliamella]|uniref:hypothetical protein n=1 Tax=unclassified Gilliamella TaxID=2685620 RepID=UPI00226A5D41|nr:MULTISPECIES: hypothetical protein [unclassified Gilliamella]MCX8583740.1 hypothetical protein [Gilliamella sp. B3372]MCX8595051.1 hypothetical protein [Gilliamella sp. B3367]
MDIKLTKYDEGTDDVYSIMQRVLLRDNPIDHLIIAPKSYISSRSTKLMDELEQSLKYVPTYQVVERIRNEEKLIAKEKLAVEKDKTKTEKARREKAESEKKILINALLQKDGSIENIAKILKITVKVVEKIIDKK